MTITEKAADRLREVAMFIYDNAEALLGDFDSVMVLNDGIEFLFILNGAGRTFIKMSKCVIAADPPKRWPATVGEGESECSLPN